MIKALLILGTMLSGAISESVFPDSKEDIASSLVMDQGWVRYPQYSNRTQWADFLGEYDKILIAKGEKNLNHQWQTITDDDYLAYDLRGDRDAMENKQHADSDALGQLLVAELAEGKGRFTKDITAGVEHFCGMTSWAVSAHLAKYQRIKSPLPDPNENILALYQGNISQLLSWTYYFLGPQMDKVRPGISKRLRAELQKRELDPFLQRDDFHWMGFKPVPGKVLNNWNPWCNMNAILCFMLLENDRDTLAAAIVKSMKSVELYMNTLCPDGCCDEGTTYWYKSTGHLMDYLECLEMITGGKVKIWDLPLIKNAGEFIINADIENNFQVNFSDGTPSRRPISYWIYRYGRACGNSRMMNFAVNSYKALGSNPEDVDWTLFYQGIEAIRAVLEMKAMPDVEYTPRDFVLYPDTQVCFQRKNGAFLATKGGHNLERHNHNDVGSCIYFVGGKPVLIDAGVGNYTKDTFGAGRHSNWFVNSDWHNLPVINGFKQDFGREAAADSFSADPRSGKVRVDVAGAYPAEAGVKSWVIEYCLKKDGTLSINGKYSLSKTTKANELHFLVNERPCILKKGVISLADGLCMQYNPKQFDASVERKSLVNLGFSSRWGDNVYRICLTAKALKAKDRYSLNIVREKKEDIAVLTERVVKTAKAQSIHMAGRLPMDKMPRTCKSDGESVDTKIGSWTSGFFPGTLWMLYNLSGDKSILHLAKAQTDKMSTILDFPISHDIGFQVNCSYGNAYRITGDSKYLPLIEEASAALASRFDSNVGATLSWSTRPDSKYPVIIDNMMNLELLEYAYKLFGCDSLRSISVAHAQTTMKNHFRPDYTTWHMIDYDPATGDPERKVTVQGYSDNSAWARGQAWAVYGYAMMYRETGMEEFLTQSENVARMLLERLPDDGIPSWDFDDPLADKAFKDASAAAVMCSAFIELSTLTKDEPLADECLEMAQRQIRALSSSDYLARPGENAGFILRHSVGNLPGGSEVDVPLVYADYYFLEALDRYARLDSGNGSSLTISAPNLRNAPDEWTWTGTFNVTKEMLGSKALYLRAADVDTFCDLEINGRNVGSTDNRFLRYEWNVKPFLRLGKNVITAHFRNAKDEARKVYDALPYPIRMNGAGEVPHLHLIRKPIVQGGWDFGPELMSCGFAGEVELLRADVALPEYLCCRQDHSVQGQCAVSLEAEILSPMGGESMVEFRFGNSVRKRNVSLLKGRNVLMETFTIKNPELWWPAGMGAQKLYDACVSAEGHTVARKVGLRKVEVGENLAFKVNGQPMFAKGANWVPSDLVEARATRERYRDLLCSARDANMNMLRVWGGGKYEKEDFYELCDSLGIMVWQDMMFCCAMYPTTDEFFAQVSSELSHQIKRLQAHPCIALWCGDNEGLDCLGWRLAKTNLPFYKDEYKKLIDLRGSLVAECDPERLYWPTSPCGGPGDMETNGWKDDSKGDMHLWDISKSALPLEKYYDFKPKFCSEFGHSSFGGPHSSLEELKAHIREKGGYENICKRIAQHYNPVSGDPDNLVYLSQMEQALALETATSYWSTLPECNGTLVWQLNDIWPGTSWSTLEYDGSWKPAQYHLKRIFAPQHISVVPSADSLHLIFSLDVATSATLWSFDGKQLWTRSSKAFPLSEFGSFAQRRGHFLQIAAGGASRTWFFDEAKNCDIRPAKVLAQAVESSGEWRVLLSTDMPAFNVWLSAPGIKGHFSDNSFTLLPGEPREVVFYGRGGKFSDFAAALRVTHLYEQSSPRSDVLLRDGWKFTKGDPAGAYEPSFDDSSWEEVRIPHDWAITGPFDKNNDLWHGSKGWEKQGITGSLPWTGTGWYRTTFSAPAGKKVELLFDGAMSHPTVYVNGRQVAQWVNGYSAVHFDITDALRPGEENVLAVCLENNPLSSRWYPGAGLYRNVHLITESAIHIPVWGTRITTPSVSHENALVCLEADVEGAQGRSLRCRTEILDSNDNIVASKEASFAGSSFSQQFEIENPSLWSPTTPSLYKAVTNIYDGAALVDSYTTTFGIRSAEFIEGKGFFLNGRQIQFKGVCLHHDQGPLGAAVHPAALRHQLEILKDMGCNAIRTSHNQPAPELVRLCDEMGFMMMVEAFDEWNSEKCVNGYHLHFKDWAEKDLTGMIRCFRNNPSVMMWSVGNEVCCESDMAEGLEEAHFLKNICHREDPTRPVTCGMNRVVRYEWEQWRDAFDIIGVNYNLKRFLTVKKNVGDRMMLWTESGSTLSSRGVYHLPAAKQFDGSHSEDQQCSSYDLEACSWSNPPDDDLAIQEDYPWALGQFIWTGFDYLGEPTPYEDGCWPNHSSMFGIVDLASIPKDRYYLVRSVWNTASPTLHILPHWNWNEGQKVPVFVYTDSPSAELFLNGKSLGVRHKEIAKNPTVNPRKEHNENRFRLMWKDVAFQKGELMAVSLDASGNPVDTVYMRTAGEPAGIRMEYDGRRLKADGEDLAYVTVSIVDKDGNLCPTADNYVNFSVSGPGSFKACANGDPTCIEPFQNPGMHAFNGKLTAIVQSSALKAGKIILSAESEGLSGEKCIFRTNF